MLTLYCFRWTETSEGIEEYVARLNKLSNETEGASFRGAFTPKSECNVVLLFEGTGFGRIVEIYKEYLKKYGAHPKIPVAKVELLFTFEEIGYPA